MKKVLAVLSLLLLVAVFAIPAAAVDVKFSGDYYIAGDYYSRTGVDGHYYGIPDNASTAFFYQSLCIQTEFAVSSVLSLVTRFSALEKIWGDTSWGGSRGDTFGRPAGTSNPDDMVAENIEVKQAYIQYNSGKAGNFIIGYAPYDFWGTPFGDSSRSAAAIRWDKPLGNWVIGAIYVKMHEGSTTYKSSGLGLGNTNDNDDNTYSLYGLYANDNIETGLKIAYRRIANEKGTVGGSFAPSPWSGVDGEINGWLLTPYFIGQFGSVRFQGELEYFDGRAEWNGPQRHTDIRALAGYADIQVAIGPAYVGGLFAYASGADAAKANKKITGTNALDTAEFAWGGVDFKPTLILWNEDVCDWAGDLFRQGPGMKNAKLFQLYAGTAVKDFDFKVALSYARANETNTYVYDFGTPAINYYAAQNSTYGWELDGTITYKITNNLSYMAGAGYLWTGKFFKPVHPVNAAGMSAPKNIYLITNKLTLTF